jgi:hypothetical protein
MKAVKISNLRATCFFGGGASEDGVNTSSAGWGKFLRITAHNCLGFRPANPMRNGTAYSAFQASEPSAMLPVDPVLLREIPVIQKIIQDEVWLEAERRGCPVSASDAIVRENVCRVIMRIGQQLRDSITTALNNSAPPPNSVTQH